MTAYEMRISDWSSDVCSSDLRCDRGRRPLRARANRRIRAARLRDCAETVSSRSMRNSPQVSVVMSVYNGEDYLSESIDSILRQTFEDFEFIIVDDASSDRTSRILAGYHESRLHILPNDARRGITGSLNRLLSPPQGSH